MSQNLLGPSLGRSKYATDLPTSTLLAYLPHSLSYNCTLQFGLDASTVLGTKRKKRFLSWCRVEKTISSSCFIDIKTISSSYFIDIKTISSSYFIDIKTIRDLIHKTSVI